MSAPAESFYAYLVSDADTAGVYPNNGPARFTSPINPPFILDETWEMGLTEIFYPAHEYNVQEPYNTFEVVHNVTDQATGEVEKHMKTVTIPRGWYDPPDLVNMVNKILARKVPKPFESRWEYVERTGRIAFKVKTGEGFRVKNRRLAYMLGFREPHNDEHTGMETSIELPDRSETRDIPLHGSANLEAHGPHMFVYTNITEYSNVGGVRAPLLRAVALAGRPEPGSSTMHREYTNIQYFSLRLTHIDNIQVILSNAYAEDMPFLEGVTLLVIHFRKKRD